MQRNYDALKIESKWQKKWSKQGLYDVLERDTNLEKEYVLVEFPYPSGNLHIGHWYAFAVPDIYVRYRRMTGVQVLYPIGFDAFGLPAENAAIKHNVEPKKWTEQNILTMRLQLESMGNAFSWNRTFSSTDPEYYKWTQWMFTKFFETGFAYKGTAIVNWDPVDNTVIANEQVLPDGTSERSGAIVEKKEMPQWMLRITNYADRLIDDLDNLDWPEHIKEAQRQWIGRSKGAEIDFTLSTGDKVSCFTTRPDTLFGVTYVVLAPENPLVNFLLDSVKNSATVKDYVKFAQQKEDQERLDNTKDKTGVKLEGVTALNPGTGEHVPVFIADYVLAHYGTGAIMAVPAHDERDNAFAKKYGLPIKSVITPCEIEYAGALLESRQRPGSFIFQLRTDETKSFCGRIAFYGGKLEQGELPTQCIIREIEEELELKLSLEDLKETYTFYGEPGKQIMTAIVSDIDEESLKSRVGDVVVLTYDEIMEDERVMPAVKTFVQQHINRTTVDTSSGILIESGDFSGMNSDEAKGAIVKAVEGRWSSTYRLRDWSVGRQRYWGTPIPIVYDPDGKPHPVPEEYLPWKLPEDVDFKPTGVAPLARSNELKIRTEKIFGEGWTPEVETMDTFVDSSWYFMRYLDPKNEEIFASQKAQQAWMPVDTYFGGAEHTTMHLLYSRFWQKALYDLKMTASAEPYKKRVNRGLILGPNGNKMSKSKGNVIDPDEQVRLVGADTVKMYLAFMGPYEGSNYPWDPGGVAGIRRFLERVYGLIYLYNEITAVDLDIVKQLHKTASKLHEDIPQYKFNTAISALMICVNKMEKSAFSKVELIFFLKLIAPFAPHLAEEMWHELGQKGSVHETKIPIPDPQQLTEDTVTIGVQINGKTRGSITVGVNDSEDEVLHALNSSALKSKINNKEFKKIIYKPGKILNIIID